MHTFAVNRSNLIILLIAFDLLILASLFIVSPAQVFIGGLALIALSAMILHPEGLIYFLILSSPLITATTKISPELNSLRILFTLTLIVFFLGRFWLQGNAFLSIPKPLYRPLTVLFIYILLTMFLAINPASVIVEFVHLIYYLTIFYTIYNLTSSGLKNRLITNVFLIMVAAYSLVILTSTGLGVFRVALLGMNPNSFSLLLLIGFAYGLFAYHTSEDLKQKFITLTGIVLICLAAFVAGSRGGWMMFAVCWSTYMWLTGKKRYVLLAAVSGIVLLFFLYSHLSVYFNFARETRIFSGLTGRPELWKGGLRVISHYPLIGTGLGCVGEVLRYYVPMANPLIPLYTHIPVLGGNLHNGYLQVLAENGIVGIAIILWAVASFVRYLYHNYKKQPDKYSRHTAVLGIALVISLLSRALVESNFPYGFLTDNILYLVTFALIVRHLQNTKTEFFRPAH